MLQLSYLTYLLEIDMGKLQDRYDICVACCESLGNIPLTFDEWLNS